MPATPSPILTAALRQLRMLRLRFIHRMADDLRTEPFKGNLWHGLFGMCLHDADAQAFAALMGADEAARPWALRPPLSAEPWIPAGAAVEAGITLIGERAIGHSQACVRAIEEMDQRGFGRERIKAAVEEVWIDAPPQEGPSRPDGSFTAWDLWVHEARMADPSISAGGLSLVLASPLRIKRDGRLLNDIPTLELLMRRLLGRIVMHLPRLPDGLFAPDEHARLLELAAQSQLLAHRIDGVRWQRRSSRTGQSMPFEGLLGRVDYGPPAGRLLPWFKLAEVIQLGSKTSFGMGVICARGLGDTG